MNGWKTLVSLPASKPVKVVTFTGFEDYVESVRKLPVSSEPVEATLVPLAA